MTTTSPSRPAAAIDARRPGPPLPGALGVVAALVSMAGSWIPSLWGDEAASVLSAQRPLSTLFPMLTHVDAVHGSYYLMLHFWIRVFGASPFSVRVPPAIAVGFAVAAVVLVVRELADPRLALVAGIVTAVLPRMTYTGEETRAYAFSAALVAWSFWVLIRLLRDRGGSRRWWLAYVVLTAAAGYAFLYSELLLVAHGVLVVAARADRAFLRRWLRNAGISIAATIPVLVFAYLERRQVSYLAHSVTTDPKSLLVGLWFSGTWFAVLAWALIVAAVVFWVADLRRGDPVLSLTLVGLVWLIVPVGLMLLSTIAVADFTGRYMTYSAPAAGILMALGIGRLVRAGRGLAVSRAGLVRMLAGTVVVAAVAAPLYLAQRTPYAKNGSDWAEISRVVGAHARRGDGVLFDEQASPSHRPRLAKYTYPAGFTGLVDPTLKTIYRHSDTWYDRTYTIAEAQALGRFAGVTTIWLVEYAPSGRSDTWGQSSLAALGYAKGATYRTHQGRVIEYTRP